MRLDFKESGMPGSILRISQQGYYLPVRHTRAFFSKGSGRS